MCLRCSPMPDLRTEAAIGKLVEAIEGDLEELALELERAKDLAEALVFPARGLNGLAGFLRQQGVQIGEMITNVGDEIATVRKNMLGEGSGLPAVEVVVKDGKRIAKRVES